VGRGVICIGVRQHKVGDDAVLAELAANVIDQRLPGLGGAPIDYHQLVAVGVPVPRYYGVAGFGMISYRQEFNFAIH
jgi:hypothetical protein